MVVSPYALYSLNLVEERLYEKSWRRRWHGILGTVSEEFPEVQVRAMDFSEVPLPLCMEFSEVRRFSSASGALARRSCGGAGV